MAKATSRKAVSAPARVKTAVVISPESFRRLGAACLAENMMQSEIVEMLINRSLSGYVVQIRGERINPSHESTDRQNSAESVNSAA
jgi:hypothetical protein